MFCCRLVLPRIQTGTRHGQPAANTAWFQHLMYRSMCVISWVLCRKLFAIFWFLFHGHMITSVIILKLCMRKSRHMADWCKFKVRLHFAAGCTTGWMKRFEYLYIHTHPLNGPFSRTTRVSQYQKGKPIWILLKQETVSGSGISWTICKSAPRSGQITMPAPHHSVFYRPDSLPAAQPTVSKQWRQSWLHNVENVNNIGRLKICNPANKWCCFGWPV